MLGRSNLIDYSLIVGVLVYELEPCDGQNQPAQLGGKSTGELSWVENEALRLRYFNHDRALQMTDGLIS